MASKEIIEYLFKANPNHLLAGTRKVKDGLRGVDDQAGRAAAGMNQSFSKMAAGFQKVGQKMQTTGRNLTVGVTLPLVYALKQAADEAIAEERSLLKLESALKRTTKATRAQLDEVNDYIAKTEVAVAVTDEELRPAFERLARTTGSVDQAQRQLTIAIDASRATGKDLETITEAMSKANMGQVGSLGRLGIATRDANGDLLSMSQVLDIMEQQFRGAADDYMQSAAGQAELAAISFGNLQEKIGEDLVPIMQDLSEIVTKVADFFRELPDPVQKAVVAMLLLKGPLVWLGGAGIKLVGAFIAKLGAMRAASEAAEAAMARHAAVGPYFGREITKGARDATSGMQVFARTVGTGAIVAGLLVSIERSIDGFSKFKRALDGSSKNVEEQALASSSAWSSTWARAMDRVGSYLIPGMRQLANETKKGLDLENARQFIDLLEQARGRGGVFETEANKIASSSISAEDGVRKLNDVLKQTPAQLDPNIAKMEALAQATGITAEQTELLKSEFEQLEAYFSYEAAVRNVESSFMDLAKSIEDVRKEDSEGGLEVVPAELLKLQGDIDNTAQALAQKLVLALDQGKMTAAEAAEEITKTQAELRKLAERAPETAGKVAGVNAELERVKSRYVEIQVNTTNARASIDQFVNAINRIPQRTVTFDRWLAGQLRAPIPGNEAGGTIPFARGGVYMANSGGGITTGPMAVIGEGREPREYVIPTDPQYRDRATALMNQAAAELGVGARPSMSSTFTANINVTGGSDPQATAAAVADAVEQAFARKKRREGSLAFT